MTDTPREQERERRKRLMEKHDPGYIHVCYREDMWDWGQDDAERSDAGVCVLSQDAPKED